MPSRRERHVRSNNFTAQYQQDPQPPSGIIVKRDWLKSYGPSEKPDRFDQIVQSWDTANKDSELANFSVCTTWGRKRQHMYLIDVHRRKMDFPELKRSVRTLADLYKANVVLVEDKASGTSLIAEMRAENFSLIQAAPALDGDKIMRLRSQTAKIEGGFVLFPKDAPWLDGYLLELVTFPNSKNDDQVDSTVFALAWSTEHSATPAIIQYYEDEVAKLEGRSPAQPKKRRVWIPIGVTHWRIMEGKDVFIPPDRVIEVSEEDVAPICRSGGKRVD